MDKTNGNNNPHQDFDLIAPERDTLPKNFVRLARKYGNTRMAMRKKRYGIWQEYTWQESYQALHDFCLGLMALGGQRGEKMCIIGDNDPEYYQAELAAHAAGMATIGIFTDASPKEIIYLVQNSDSVFVVAHDQEQCDKLLEIRDEIPAIRTVIYWEERGLWGYDDPWLMSFEAVQKLGQDYAQEHPDAFENSVNQGKGDDIAILSYTSGTTGLPKGAMITHANLLMGSGYVARIMPVGDGDDYVSFSPLAWITEQSLGLALHVTRALIVNFPEMPETVQIDIREISPVSLLFPGRLWESLVSLVHVRMADAHPSNRFLYNLLMPIGYKVADMMDSGQTPNLLWRFLYWISDIIMFAPLRDKLGLSRIRYAYTSGAATSPDVQRFFRAIDVELLQLYGSTECQTHTLHHMNDVQPGTVGKPPPGVQIKLTDAGEIAVKSGSTFSGYYKAPEKTTEALIDGWFHTGDAGYIDDKGHLIYLDRMKDMRELANGEKFSPQYIEIRLNFSQYISNTIILGNRDVSFVSAIITINFDNVARRAEKQGLSFTTLVDLSQKDEVYDLIARDVKQVNASLPPASRVRRFTILHKSLDADEAELTRTRKLRRGYIEEKYSDILQAIYSGEQAIMVTAEVAYRDGRTGTVKTDLKIYDVEPTVAG